MRKVREKVSGGKYTKKRRGKLNRNMYKGRVNYAFLNAFTFLPQIERHDFWDGGRREKLAKR